VLIFNKLFNSSNCRWLKTWLQIATEICEHGTLEFRLTDLHQMGYFFRHRWSRWRFVASRYGCRILSVT
jgi:hypothetical protein